MARVLFLHGLESGPNGSKATWLGSRHSTVVPALDTRAAVATRDAALQRGEPWTWESEGTEASLTRPLAQAREGLASRPDVIVGSSFGGALLLQLLHEGSWTGPSVFLAGAGLLLTRHRTLPTGCRAVLIHGRHDDLVPLEHSRTLARGQGLGVQLWEVGDGHRLTTILEDGTLEAALGWALAHGQRTEDQG